MKIAMLAPANSVHTVRWANALTLRRHTVYLLSCHPFADALHPQVRRIRLAWPPPWGYVLNAPALRRRLGGLHPDLLHSHYASGYGTLGQLSGFVPRVLSVWGSDVFEFPCRSRLAAGILRRNLQAADHVCSTSHAMGQQVRRLVPEVPHLSITPFGVDVQQFSPRRGAIGRGELVIGTIKSLEHVYGIDVLIRGFHRCREILANRGDPRSQALRLVIGGGGSQERALRQLAASLGIASCVKFLGRIPHQEVPAWLNRFEIYVAVSRAESFGVAVVEASACGLPVVVSNISGLAEVVSAERTGLLVPPEDPESLAEALLRLVQQPDLRASLGDAGRQYVLAHYDWEDSLSIMEDVYRQVTG